MTTILYIFLLFHNYIISLYMCASMSLVITLKYRFAYSYIVAMAKLQEMVVMGKFSSTDEQP